MRRLSTVFCIASTLAVLPNFCACDCETLKTYIPGLACSQGSGGSGSGSGGGGTSGTGGTGEPPQPTSREKTFFAAADAYTDSLNPLDNYGSEPAIYTGFVNLGPTGEEYFNAFVRFDLSEIPSDARIEDATLKLTTDANASTVKPLGTVTVAIVKEVSWAENSITYFNMPSVGDYIVSRQITFETATTWDFPVAAAVRSWLIGTPNRGFWIKSRTFSPGSHCYGTFYASELAPEAGPQLRVRWTEG
jgi:hypothetical protein